MASSWFEVLLVLVQSHVDLLVASAFFFFLFLVYFLQLNNNSKLPTSWPLAGMFPSLLFNLSNFHDWHAHVLRECGGTFVFRGPWFLGMDMLVTSDPANVNHVFNANFANYPKGDEFVEIFDILGDGIFNADGDSWRAQRKKAHGLVSDPRFRSFAAEYSRDKVENGLVPLMSRLAEQEAVVDLQDVFLRLTFDMTCNLVFGVDPGSLSVGFPALPFAHAMDRTMEALFFRHALPRPCWRLMRWLRIWKEKKLCEAWGVIEAFVSQNIAKSREEGQSSRKVSLLASYVNNVDVSDTADRAGYKYVRDTTVNLMFAGRDTTATALSWFFWLLSKNPRIESKILEELEGVDDRKSLDADELAKTVYLHAALCEALRLYPPVHLEHKAPARADFLPSGERAPSGRKVLFSTYAMGRMEGVWGEDWAEFRPERWISERGRLRHEPGYKFLAFNCGPRMCLGKDIAFTQMKAVVAAVLCNFRLEGVGGQVVEPMLSVLLHMKNGWKVRIKKKKKKSSDQTY